MLNTKVRQCCIVYRRVTLRPQRKEKLRINHKPVLRVMHERGLLVLPRRLTFQGKEARR